ncbi:MAG TPA: GDSL-type esterase/lipase family protein [Alphaproteobacteria bacterium]|jgi:lysophospholipase L1-like esterase|nr:GDSL-type esterase/lipase family protein [Alphaproteobacteria bacterium]
MQKEKGFVSILILVLVLIIAGIYFLYPHKTKDITKTAIPTPTPYQFPYKNPEIIKNQSYRTILVGDSIVNSLGVNANILRLDLIKYYPDSEFVNYNYGYPSSNVLDLYKRLTEGTQNGPTDNQAILTQQFEFIVIESFGNNPLSQFPLAEGLQKQNDELEKSVREILKERPNAALAFMTPIALDPVNYAKGSRDLSPEVRKQWVAERVAYIDNHRKFAEEKGIPVIDVYKASLKADGTVDKSYISNDFIHPSEKGVELISQTIADYIFNNKIFPQ